MKNLKQILASITVVCLIGGVAVNLESITPEIFVTASAEGENEYKEGTY